MSTLLVRGERLLVCGSRTWTNREILWTELDSIRETLGVALLIHGGARGADRMAGEWAEERGIPVAVYPADWNRDGRAAGPIRNRRMLQEGRPTWAAVFAVDLKESRGTADMYIRLRRARVSVSVINLAEMARPHE